MQQERDQFFSRSGFPLDQDIDIGPRELRDGIPDSRHDRAVADQRAVALAHGSVQSTIVENQPPHFQSLADRHDEMIHRKRLGQEIECAIA